MKGTPMSDQTLLLPLLDSGCGCGPTHRLGPRDETQAATGSTGSRSCRLVGLTCGHCVASVTEEVQDIRGVTAVAIDLVPGGESRLTISGDREVSREEIAAAVSEAGYRLVEEATA